MGPRRRQPDQLHQRPAHRKTAPGHPHHRRRRARPVDPGRRRLRVGPAPAAGLPERRPPLRQPHRLSGLERRTRRPGRRRHPAVAEHRPGPLSGGRHRPRAGAGERPGPPAGEPGKRRPGARPLLAGSRRAGRHPDPGSAGHRRHGAQRLRPRGAAAAPRRARQRPADPPLRHRAAAGGRPGHPPDAGHPRGKRSAPGEHPVGGGVRAPRAAHDLHPGGGRRGAAGHHRFRHAAPAPGVLPARGPGRADLGPVRSGGGRLRRRTGSDAGAGRFRRAPRRQRATAPPLPAGGPFQRALPTGQGRDRRPRHRTARLHGPGARDGGGRRRPRLRRGGQERHRHPAADPAVVPAAGAGAGRNPGPAGHPVRRRGRPGPGDSVRRRGGPDLVKRPAGRAGRRTGLPGQRRTDRRVGPENRPAYRHRHGDRVRPCQGA